MCKLGTVDLRFITSKSVYLSLISEKFVQPTALKQWEQTTQIDTDNWDLYFSSIYYTTLEKYSREFQFKVIHRYLPVNSVLYKWKLVDSERCTYCFIHKETLDHLFYECSYAKNLFYKIEEWLKNTGVVMPTFTLVNVIFGLLEGKYINLINHIILIYKLVYINFEMLQKQTYLKFL